MKLVLFGIALHLTVSISVLLYLISNDTTYGVITTFWLMISMFPYFWVDAKVKENRERKNGEKS